MSNQSILNQFRDILSQSISRNEMLKASLGNYQGNDATLKNLYIRKVKIKRVEKLSFTYRYKTRDIFKNYDIKEGKDLLLNFMSNDFKICTLFTVHQEIVLEHNKKGEFLIRKKQILDSDKMITFAPDLVHDKVKKRLISSVNKDYLRLLKVTDPEGNVLKNAQDKYRQINQYIEILSSLIKEVPGGKVERVVDMGSGKGYLTFALYDYLHNVLNLNTEVVGVEFRKDLVELCSEIALKSDFSQLKFTEGTIQGYQQDIIDILIALHACDTATDDAIYQGISKEAKLIVVAPCCHKQIRREMEKSKIKNDVSFLTKYGIFLERQAEMVTDGIRAQILQYYGYKTKVIEFVSDIHTPKNVLLVGIKSKKPDDLRRRQILDEIKSTKSFFGIGTHHLESLCGL
ncbi:MAG: SAM-dependent methyltransferase [Pedobacter sp.]|nr:MAG: SAM-dependent methyltransferase [Pedobacter sp.]